MASNSEVSKSGDQLYIKKDEIIYGLHPSCYDLHSYYAPPDKYRQTISKFEPSTGSSEQVNQRQFSFRTPRAETVAGNRLFLFGVAPDGSNEHILTKFDLLTYKWTTLSSRPWKPVTAQILALGDFVYVVYSEKSGRIAKNRSSDEYSTERNFFVRYSITKNQWKTLSPRQRNGYSFQLIELNGLLYHIAKSFDHLHINEVEKYNPETDQWRSLASPNYCHNYDIDTISFSGKIYIISSYGFEEYTPETNTWKKLEKLSAYLKGTLVVYNRKLWAVSRVGEDRGIPWKMNQFDMSSGKWNSLPEVNCEPMKTDFRISLFVCHSEK